MPRRKRMRANRELATRRALTMWNHLLQGDASKHELIQAVRAECVDATPYGASADDSFDKDKRFLSNLGVKFKYDKHANVYRLDDHARPLLQLPLAPEQLELLALIENAFRATPYGERIHQLMQTLKQFVPAERVALADSQALLSIVLDNVEAHAPNPELLAKLAEAIHLDYRIEFDYEAPSHGLVVHHLVEPYDSLEYREGHIYFEGHNVRLDTDISYRVDRIVAGSLRKLPNKIARGKRREEWIPLRYKLAAKMARHGASRRFPEHQEEKLADGSVIVHAQVLKSRLWWASKTLLKYGENCIVLEPPELVTEMKRVVAEMAENYGNVVI